MLAVRAQDSGTTPQTSTVSVYVNVVDVNDNAPVFDPSTYSNEIEEDAEVGQPVLTVIATDIDSGMCTTSDCAHR